MSKDFRSGSFKIKNNGEYVDYPALSVGVDGKSAYEIAVDNGYTGTEAEWIEAQQKGGIFVSQLNVTPTDLNDAVVKANAAATQNNTYTKVEINKKISDKVAEIVANAPEDFDTLKEISDWISNHEDDAAAMNSAIQRSAGQIVTGTDYTINGQTQTAKSGAEIFNNYNNNIAIGLYSHAEGSSVTASGDYSHAQNFNTIAAGVYQTAIGKYNIEDSSNKYALIIGNGSSSARSNALAVDWDGKIYAGNSSNGVDLTTLKSDVSLNQQTLGARCKNLLDISAFTATAAAGITPTVNSNGTVTINGTATNTSDFLYSSPGGYSNMCNMKPGKTYTISSGNSSVIICVDYSKNGSSWNGTALVSNVANSATFTVPSDAVGVYIRFRCTNGTTVSNSVVYPMLRSADITDSTFEAYQQPPLQTQIDDIKKDVFKIENPSIVLKELTWTKSYGGKYYSNSISTSLSLIYGATIGNFNNMTADLIVQPVVSSNSQLYLMANTDPSTINTTITVRIFGK